MAKAILTIGYEIPGYGDDCYDFNSDQSLLDADIVVFEPNISSYISYINTYQGLPSLDEDASFRLKDASARWKQDLNELLSERKTVFVFLGDYQQVFIRTGQKTYSSAARNARQTNIVTSYDNLQCLPITFSNVTAKSGSTVLFKGNPIFSSFWKEFGGSLEYKCYFDISVAETLFTTRVGTKSVGAMVRTPTGGHLVILPKIEYDEDEFTVTEQTDVRWPRFVRQVLQFLRWSPAPWLNGLSAHSLRGNDGLYQIFLVT